MLSMDVGAGFRVIAHTWGPLLSISEDSIRSRDVFGASIALPVPCQKIGLASFCFCICMRRVRKCGRTELQEKETAGMEI